MSRSSVVIGAGGHGKVIIATLRAAGYTVTGVFDDSPKAAGSAILGVAVKGPVTAAAATGLPAVIAIGQNDARMNIALRTPLTWLAVAHPSAVIDESVQFGAGSVALANSVIQPSTRVGSHVIVNTSASVDHDCSLGDYVHIAPGARIAGGVTIGEGALVGVGAAIAPECSIGSWSIIGAGAAVVRDIPPRSVALGVPARIVREV